MKRLQHILIVNPHGTLSCALEALLALWQQDAFVGTTLFNMADEETTLYDLYLQTLPDLVLVDGQASDWDCQLIPHLLQQLRGWGQETGFRSILVVLDEVGDSQRSVQALRFGADDLLSAQLDKEELQARLLSHLRRHMDAHQAPISGMLNHRLLHRILERLLGQQRRLQSSPDPCHSESPTPPPPWSIAYLCLEGLVAYRQQYGQQPLRQLQQHIALLCSNLLHAPDWAFDLSEVEEGVYALLAPPERLERMLPVLLRHFDQSLPSFYSENDRQQGFMLIKEAGLHRKSPLLRIGAGVLHSHLSPQTQWQTLEPQGKRLARLALRHTPGKQSVWLSDALLLQGPVQPKSVCQDEQARVLLWEPDAALGFMLKQALQLQGFEVHHCESPAAAFRSANETCYQLLWLDPLVSEGTHSQPDWTTLQRLRQVQLRCPMVVSSSLHYPAEALLHGADAYLPKPFDLRALLAALNQLVLLEDQAIIEGMG